MDKNAYTQISPMSRAHFLSDLAGLAWTGDVEYKVAFETIQLLQFETDYLVWINGINFLSGIRFMLSNGIISQNYYVSIIVIVSNSLPERRGHSRISAEKIPSE